MSDTNQTRPIPGTIESLSMSLEVTAIATLMGAMQGADKKLGVEAAGMVLKALGKESKPKETAPAGQSLTINMLGPLKDSLKGVAEMASLIREKESATDATTQ